MVHKPRISLLTSLESFLEKIKALLFVTLWHDCKQFHRSIRLVTRLQKKKDSWPSLYRFLASGHSFEFMHLYRHNCLSSHRKTCAKLLYLFKKGGFYDKLGPKDRTFTLLWCCHDKSSPIHFLVELSGTNDRCSSWTTLS